MPASFSFEQLSANWYFWVIPVMGLAFAGLTMFAGRAFFRSRRQAPPPSKAPPQFQHDPFDSGKVNERREAIRRFGTTVPVYISDADAQAQPFEGWVVDRSVGGIGLSVDHEVPVDTVLSIRAHNAPQTIPWVQVRVLRCQAQGDIWELGCRFVRTPPWNIMLLFG